MGQYFFPALLKCKENNVKNTEDVIMHFYSHDYGNGLKLMEHSYVGNDFVNAVCSELTGNPNRLVWCGDYADELPNVEEKRNLYDILDSCEEKSRKPKDEDNDFNWKDHPFFLNHDKKQWFDLRKIEPMEYGLTIHPLHVLTANSNGRGGGDYEGENMKAVGTWSGDLIEVTEQEPQEDGWTEIVPQFKENW